MKRFWWFLVVGLLGTLISGLVIIPAKAQTPIWHADFFDNPYLYGTPILSQNVAAVAFNWGRSTPGSNIPADHFSARFTTTTYFSAGTYRFTITADDGIHLIVDGQRLIDTFDNPRVGTALSAEIVLASAYHSIQVDFHEIEGDAYVYANWIQVVTTIPSQPQASGAWLAEYFNNKTLSQPSIVVRYESTPSHDWNTDAPVDWITADNFSVRWTATQTFVGGIYYLTVTVDDGIRVYINGERVLDEWHGNPTIATYTRYVYLRNGSNTIVIEYYEETGIAKMLYSLVCTSNVPIPPLEGTSSSNLNAYVTVNTGSLNVRSTPAIGNNILRQVHQGEVCPAIGRNSDGTWWQIRIGNIVGWVYSRYVSVTNAQNVPVIP